MSLAFPDPSLHREGRSAFLFLEINVPIIGDSSEGFKIRVCKIYVIDCGIHQVIVKSPLGVCIRREDLVQRDKDWREELGFNYVSCFEVQY